MRPILIAVCAIAMTGCGLPITKPSNPSTTGDPTDPASAPVAGWSETDPEVTIRWIAAEVDAVWKYDPKGNTYANRTKEAVKKEFDDAIQKKVGTEVRWRVRLESINSGGFVAIQTVRFPTTTIPENKDGTYHTIRIQLLVDGFLPTGFPTEAPEEWKRAIKPGSPALVVGKIKKITTESGIITESFGGPIKPRYKQRSSLTWFVSLAYPAHVEPLPDK